MHSHPSKSLQELNIESFRMFKQLEILLESLKNIEKSYRTHIVQGVSSKNVYALKAKNEALIPKHTTEQLLKKLSDLNQERAVLKPGDKANIQNVINSTVELENQVRQSIRFYRTMILGIKEFVRKDSLLEIRVEAKDLIYKFKCAPFPESGDHNINKELDKLKRLASSDITQQSLELVPKTRNTVLAARDKETYLTLTNAFNELNEIFQLYNKVDTALVTATRTAKNIGEIELLLDKYKRKREALDVTLNEFLGVATNIIGPITLAQNNLEYSYKVLKEMHTPPTPREGGAASEMPKSRKRDVDAAKLQDIKTAYSGMFKLTTEEKIAEKKEELRSQIRKKPS